MRPETLDEITTAQFDVMRIGVTLPLGMMVPVKASYWKPMGFDVLSLRKE
jgi:hypothetical protein